MLGPKVWDHPARLLRVVDGDTIDVTYDEGRRRTRSAIVRVLAVNCAEKRTDPTAWLAASVFTTAWLLDAWRNPEDLWPLRIIANKVDNFGRDLGVVFRTFDGASLAADLIAAGHHRG